MEIKTKKIYIAVDGTEFNTIEECQEYESNTSISAVEDRLVDLINQQNYDISLKNRYKANKFGKLAVTEALLLDKYKRVNKMMKVPIEKMTSQDAEKLQNSIAAVRRYRLQRQQQKDILDDLRHSIKERGEQIKNLYEKLVKLKLEKLNS